MTYRYLSDSIIDIKVVIYVDYLYKLGHLYTVTRNKHSFAVLRKVNDEQRSKGNINPNVNITIK